LGKQLGVLFLLFGKRVLLFVLKLVILQLGFNQFGLMFEMNAKLESSLG